MTRKEFEKIVGEEFPRAVPERFHRLLKNLAFIVEDEAPDKNLLGLYHGVALVERGEAYGMGGTMPDTITLYQKTIEDEARASGLSIAQVVRETLWHEVAHHFGYDEEQVQDREERDTMRR